MKTIKEIIIESKCRKGPSAGVTKRGAFWIAFAKSDQYFSVTSRRGGDGVGQSSADVSVGLKFRHFRDGTVQAITVTECWHQNTGTNRSTVDVSQILNCTTAEEVIAILKGTNAGDGGRSISSIFEEDLVADLAAIGIPAALPGPDEEEAQKEAREAATAAT